MLHAEFRVQDPLPGKARHDEREREGIKENRAERIFAPHLAIKEGGKEKTDEKGKDHRQNAKDGEVLDRPDPARRSPEAFILVQPDEIEPRQHAGFGEGIQHRPGGAADEDDRGGQNHRDRGDHRAWTADKSPWLFRRRGACNGWNSNI
jgi:hypothetical protein